MSRILARLAVFAVVACAAFAAQAASACTVTPMASGVFYARGLLGQYCLVNPPQGGQVTGQCWGCTSSGGLFGGTSCGWHTFAGTATPTGTPSYGYTFNLYSDLGHVVRQCNGG